MAHLTCISNYACFKRHGWKITTNYEKLQNVCDHSIHYVVI